MFYVLPAQDAWLSFHKWVIRFKTVPSVIFVFIVTAKMFKIAAIGADMVELVKPKRCRQVTVIFVIEKMKKDLW